MAAPSFHILGPRQNAQAPEVDVTPCPTQRFPQARAGLLEHSEEQPPITGDRVEHRQYVLIARRRVNHALRGGQANSAMPRWVRLDTGVVEYLSQRSEIVAKDPWRQRLEMLVDPLLDLTVLDVLRPPPSKSRLDPLPMHPVVLPRAFVDIDPRL